MNDFKFFARETFAKKTKIREIRKTTHKVQLVVYTYIWNTLVKKQSNSIKI